MDAPAQAPERLFFALWPGDAVREQIAHRARLLPSTGDAHARPVASARYHLTLRFLGQFAALPAALVAGAMAAGEAQSVPAFDLVLDRAGSFHGGRLWWLGPSVVPAPLQALVDGLASTALPDVAATGSGVPAEPFIAHVTVARNAATPPAAAPIEPLPWHVDRFALIASGGRHPGYRLLAQWPLQPPGRHSPPR